MQLLNRILGKTGLVGRLIIFSALVLLWRDRRYLLVGWFWFLGTLVPMIGIITVGDQAMADRYAYVAFIGLFVALVWALGDILTVANFGIAGIAALIGYGLVEFLRNRL